MARSVDGVGREDRGHKHPALALIIQYYVLLHASKDCNGLRGQRNNVFGFAEMPGFFDDKTSIHGVDMINQCAFEAGQALFHQVGRLELQPLLGHVLKGSGLGEALVFDFDDRGLSR